MCPVNEEELFFTNVLNFNKLITLENIIMCQNVSKNLFFVFSFSKIGLD